MSRGNNYQEKQSIRLQRKRIINDKSNFNITEEFNVLRTNIMFSSIDSDCKAIGITSPNVAEGKTIISLNLAISLAKAGEKVLLMDCDLRAPKVAKLTDIHGSTGLSNLLVNQVKLSETINSYGNTKLDIITSGSKPPNPSEMLGSDAMKELIEYLKGYYDYILVDLPPVNLVTDAVVASKYLNGMVLIAKSGYTKKEDLLGSIAKIDSAGSKILGIVLNSIDRDAVGYNKQKKYGSYRYTGKYYTDKE